MGMTNRITFPTDAVKKYIVIGAKNTDVV